MKNSGGSTLMAKQRLPVKGGWIARDSKTGRFLEVQSENGRAKASSISEDVVKSTSAKRSEALKRLANR